MEWTYSFLIGIALDRPVLKYVETQTKEFPFSCTLKHKSARATLIRRRKTELEFVDLQISSDCHSSVPDSGLQKLMITGLSDYC